jgi:hypothetical protein
MLRVHGRDVGVRGEFPAPRGGEFRFELGTFPGGQLGRPRGERADVLYDLEGDQVLLVGASAATSASAASRGFESWDMVTFLSHDSMSAPAGCYS